MQHKCASPAVMNIVKCVCAELIVEGFPFDPNKRTSKVTFNVHCVHQGMSSFSLTCQALPLPHYCYCRIVFVGVLYCPKCPQACIASSEIRYVQRVKWIMKCLIYPRSTSQEGAPGGNTTPRRNTSALMHRRACGGTDLHYNDLQGTIIWCRHKCSYS